MEMEVFSRDCFSVCCQISVKLGHLEDNKKIHVNVEFLDEWSYFAEICALKVSNGPQINPPTT